MGNKKPMKKFVGQNWSIVSLSMFEVNIYRKMLDNINLTLSLLLITLIHVSPLPHAAGDRFRRGTLSRTGMCPNPMVNYKVKDDRLYTTLFFY